MDLSNPEETPGIIRIASAKRHLRLSPRGKPLNPQPKGLKIRRKNKSKYVGVFFDKQSIFISVQIELQLRAKTIRKLNDDTIEVKCKTTTGTKWIYGRIVAHGGKFTLAHCSRINRYPNFISQDYFHFSSFIHTRDNLDM